MPRKKIIDIKIKEDGSDQIENSSEMKPADQRSRIEEEFLKTITTHDQEPEAKSAKPKTTRGRKSIKKSVSLEPVRESSGEKPARKFFKFVMFLIYTALIISGFYYAGFMIASVEIEVESEKETQSKVFDVSFAKGAVSESSGANLKLPLYEYKKAFSYTENYPATGAPQGQVDAYARGNLTVYNENSQTQQILIAGTRFESQDGKIFRTTSRIVVPGYKMVKDSQSLTNLKLVPGTTTVEIKADKPGLEYNLEPSKFTIPGFAGSQKFEKIYGLSTVKFTGGGTNEVKLVTADDIKKAKALLVEAAFEKAKNEVMAEAPETQKLLDKAVKFDLYKISTPKEGSTADNFSAVIEGALAILVFDENEVKRLIESNLANEQSLKVNLSESSYQIFYESPEVDFDKQTINLKVNVRRDLKAVVDTLVFKQKIAGTSVENMKKELLKIDGIQKIKVSVWPFWVTEVPSNIDRIKIEVK